MCSFCKQSNSDDQTTVKHVEEEGENIIETQKNRAMVLWQHWYHLGNFNETVYSEVMKKLKNGEVPSIFHTLCRSVDERLFLPDTKFDYMKTISGDASTSKEKIVENIPVYIYLSAKTVEVGVALCRVDGEILSDKQDSYLKEFFCDDNKMARVHIVDHQLSNKWTFDEEYTKIVTNLVNAPAKMVGHDVEVTRLKEPFYLDWNSGKNLITRSLSRGVVADCFRRSKRGTNHGIVGNPGIGKSWTLLYALMAPSLPSSSFGSSRTAVPSSSPTQFRSVKVSPSLFITSVPSLVPTMVDTMTSTTTTTTEAPVLFIMEEDSTSPTFLPTGVVVAIPPPTPIPPPLSLLRPIYPIAT
jgi:hypothetical protein